jgi:hypothetical protein
VPKKLSQPIHLAGNRPESAAFWINSVAISVLVLKRIMFSVADEKNPDVVRSLTGSQLEGFLAEKGETLAEFSGYITG